MELITVYTANANIKSENKNYKVIYSFTWSITLYSQKCPTFLHSEMVCLQNLENLLQILRNVSRILA